MTNTRPLGNTDLHITPIGFGSWAVGGGNWSYGWGNQEDQDSIAAIHRALDLGVNWIDTAAVYGLGHSEEVVAQALKTYSGKKPYVFTKCAMVWNDKGEVSHSIKADSVRKECEASLRRLQTDTIDLYQIHWPNPDEEIEEGWTELAKLQQEGKIRHIGVSNFSVAQMERAAKIAPITSLQPPYSMLRPAIGNEILPYCEKNNIGVIVYSPMLSGILTGGMTLDRAKSLPANDWRKNNKEFNSPNLERNLGLVEFNREIGAKHDKTPAEVALAWVLKNTAVTGAIVGGRSPKQVEGVVGAMDFRLTDEEYNAINDYINTKVKVD